MPSLRLLLCALAATACASPGPAPATSSDGQEPPETPPSIEAEVTEWSIGDQEDEGPHVFKTDRIHRIEVDLPAEAVNDLFLEPYELVVGSVTIDGAQLEEVGVRLRGKIGSFRTLDGKPKLKLDFNAFVDGRRFQGLEALSLNNSVVDCSYLKEAVSYRVFEELEVPASRYAYASVTINGLDYGLYGIVETQDDRYLNARWEQDDGNLYDGKYIWYGGHSYQLLDFGDGVDELYQLEEGDEVGHADIAAISTTLAEVWGQPDFYARMGELLDWEEIHREWAGEQWVGQNDGYCINKNNYRVYFDPEDGRAELIPWDLDYALLQDYEWGRSWASPAGNLARGCWQDSQCAAAQQEAVADALDRIEAMGLPELVDELSELTEDEALSDPRRECARGDILPWRDYVLGWVETRSDYMRDQWGL